MNRSRLTGTLGAFGANVIFGLSYYFSRMALQSGAHPLVILQVRFTVAFLVLTGLLLLGVIRVSYRHKPLLRLGLMAIMQPLLYFIFELYGIAHSSTALSGAVIGTVPAVVTLCAALFLRERPSALQWSACLLSVGCIVLFSLIGQQNGATDTLGLLLLVGAVLTATAFNLLSRSTATQFSAWERTYAMFAVATLGFGLITPAALGGDYLSQLRLAAIQPDFWGAIFYLAVLSSVAAYFLYNHATGKIGLVKASAFSAVITVVSTVTGVFLLHEPMTLAQIILCAVIILCVYAINREPAPKAKPSSQSEKPE